MQPKCSNIALPSLKRRQGLFVSPLWKRQRHSLKGRMKDEYKELIRNQSSPVFLYRFRNPPILMMNLCSKRCRSFWGEFHLSQLRNVPCSVELSRPPALCKTAWTSRGWECAKRAEPTEKPSSALQPPECQRTHHKPLQNRQSNSGEPHNHMVKPQTPSHLAKDPLEFSLVDLLT